LGGGAADDYLNGGRGNDTANYYYDAFFGGTQGVVVDLDSNWAKDGFGNYDTLVSLENVYGTNSAYPGYPAWSDFLYGSYGDNVLWGAGGNDYIDGKGGADWILGGVGNDYLLGGGGSDLFALANEIRAGEYDVIADFTPGADYLQLAAANQGTTYFGESAGYGYAYVTLGGGNAYTVLAQGVTGAQLQAGTSFVATA
jgi:Ca2+-binding RTX toxin-like protein